MDGILSFLRVNVNLVNSTNRQIDVMTTAKITSMIRTNKKNS